MKLYSQHNIFQFIKGYFDSVHIVLSGNICSRNADSERKWSSQLLTCTLIAYTCMDVTHPLHTPHTRDIRHN